MRGSVTNILSPAGTVVKGYDYDEFGQSSKKGDDNFLNEMTFTGSVMDASSGLQYMNARYYQPSTGRFLSQDTYSGNPYDPWTQHLYSYTGNNPVNFIDPTGHSREGLQRQINEYKAELKVLQLNKSSYAKGMQKYAEQGNWDAFKYLSQRNYEGNKRIEELNEKIASLEKQYEELGNLQNLIDTKQYDKISQFDYSNVPLYDNSSISSSGCGMIAAIIAESKLGGTVDVYDAYDYFNQPENQLFNTGAIGPYAVTSYLTERGYSVSPAGFELEPMGVFITYYQYTQNKTKVWHYVCLTTDITGAVQAHNNYNKHDSFRDFMFDDDLQGI